MVLLSILTAAILGTQSSPASWYGPGSVTFNVQFVGNPYDPDQNDVRVRFTDEHHNVVERLAYFDGQAWRATLVAPTSGKYKPVLVRNGKISREEGIPGVLLVSQKLPHGFIRINPSNPKGFVWDDGTTVNQLTKIDADSVSQTDPWWPQNDPYALKDQLWRPALANLQRLIDASTSVGANVEMRLFSWTAMRGRWTDHPWNTANGGLLKSPADFFSDPEAKRRAKMWLRYACARYGSYPALIGWDLSGQGVWQTEMAAYMRSVDPYRHVIIDAK